MLLDLQSLWEGPPPIVIEVRRHGGAGYARPFAEPLAPMPMPLLAAEDEMLALAFAAGLPHEFVLAFALADRQGRI